MNVSEKGRSQTPPIITQLGMLSALNASNSHTPARLDQTGLGRVSGDTLSYRTPLTPLSIPTKTRECVDSEGYLDGPQTKCPGRINTPRTRMRSIPVRTYERQGATGGDLGKMTPIKEKECNKESKKT